MTGQSRKKWAKTAVYAVALAAPLAVSGCASQAGTNSATGTSGATSTPSGAPSSPVSTPSTNSSTANPTPVSSPSTPATSAPSAPPAALNGTGGTGLVVADGSSKVLMNGKTVDFGVEVHDPAFSPDGKKVAFIDGGGNLVVANADGTGQVEAAKNMGTKWSHPTWQVTVHDQYDAGRDNIFLASSFDGATLWSVSATAHDGKLTRLSLNHGAGQDMTGLPQAGNQWPSESGPHGAAVYEHDNGSSSDVYIRDDYLRQQGGLKIKDAAQPSFALVGGSQTTAPNAEIAFVRKVNGHQHVFLYSEAATSTGDQVSAPKDLTPNSSTDASAPALSPDGKTVAYSTANGIFTVSVKGGAAKQVTDTPGFPAFRSAF